MTEPHEQLMDARIEAAVANSKADLALEMLVELLWRLEAAGVETPTVDALTDSYRSRADDAEDWAAQIAILELPETYTKVQGDRLAALSNLRQRRHLNEKLAAKIALEDSHRNAIDPKD